MAIGTTVTTSMPVVGTTVRTLTKVSDGVYSVVESGVPVVLKLKPASLGALRSGIQLSMAKNCGMLETYPASASGKVSGNVNLNFSLGSVVTTTYARNFLKELGSLLCQDGILDALIAGSDV